MPCKVNGMILKHFLIKIKKHTFLSFFFLCLQAVNYLTSTHNEQCKTSKNLIKRQRQGPSADGKWLTQLIKHPRVRLKIPSSVIWMESIAHFNFFPVSFAFGISIAFITLTLVWRSDIIDFFSLSLSVSVKITFKRSVKCSKIQAFPAKVI